MTMLKRFLSDDAGSSAVEYGLIAGLVAVAAISALTALGDSLSDLYAGAGGGASI